MAITIPAPAPEAPLEGVVVTGKNTAVSAPADATETAQLSADTPVKPERPSYLPDGFDTPEALAEAFKALQVTPKTAAPPKTGTIAITTPEDAAKIAAEKGVDMAAMSAEFAADGELSAASLALLETKGLSRAVVDSYIAGQQATAALLGQELATHVGGAEELSDLLKWASTGLNASEIAAFNSLLNIGEMATSKLALSGLRAQRDNALGNYGILLNGAGVPANGGVQPFDSQAQVTAIMRTREYKTDPAVRYAVEQRLAVTTAF